MSRDLGPGLWYGECERCGQGAVCRLKQFDDRYLWACEDEDECEVTE